MRVGIGVTSYNRPQMLEKCLEQIKKHTFSDDVTIYVAQDSDEDRQGVAKRKNECLRALKDCDYIFLFDDDCWPIRDGWVEFFISGAGNTHVLYLNDKMHNPIHEGYSFKTYHDCGGVFMYIPKTALDKIGAFNEDFELWGFEHAEWSLRYYKEFLNTKYYFMLKGTDDYLHSEDYSNPDHKSSITNDEKNLLFKKNWPIFAKGITQIYRAL